MGDKGQPRRAAKRRASQEIVTAVLDAASELVAANGVEQTSTNAIAARAGVSVGSLYRYFPNKQAVMAAVAKRSNDGIERAVRDALQSEGTPKERYLAAVRAYLAADTLALRAALIQHLPKGWESSGIPATEAAVEVLARDFVRELDGSEDTFRRVLMLTMAVRGAFQGCLRQPEFIQDGSLLTFVEELVNAVLGEAG